MIRYISLSALLLAGCVSTTPLPGPGKTEDAKFTDATGSVVHCDNPGGMAIFRGGWHAPVRYAECKDEAERMGLVRVKP